MTVDFIWEMLLGINKIFCLHCLSVYIHSFHSWLLCLRRCCLSMAWFWLNTWKPLPDFMKSKVKNLSNHCSRRLMTKGKFAPFNSFAMQRVWIKMVAILWYVKFDKSFFHATILLYFCVSFFLEDSEKFPGDKRNTSTEFKKSGRNVSCCLLMSFSHQTHCSCWQCVLKGSRHSSKNEPLCNITLQEGSFPPFPLVVDFVHQLPH